MKRPLALGTIAVVAVGVMSLEAGSAVADATVKATIPVHTIGRVSPYVARVALEKRGYTVRRLTPKGDVWEAVAVKGGSTRTVQIQMFLGRVDEVAPQ